MLFRSINPYTPFHGRDGAVRWFAFDNFDPRGITSCVCLFDYRNTDNAAAHFVTFVRSPAERRALLVVVGTVVSLQGRSSDMDSSAGEASITTEPGGSMTARAVADTSADAIQNGAPGPTIDSIEGPAVAAPAIDTPAQLLDLARGYDRAGSTDTTAPGAQVAAVTREIPGYGCPLGPDQVVLAEVLWQGALGVAVYDTANGTVSVVDPTCATLTSVAP